jgi:hypothetical protein
MQAFITPDHLIWRVKDDYGVEALGILPQFLRYADPHPAREQIHEAYAHGGGWNAFEGFTLNTHFPLESWALSYPGDPDMRLIAYTRLRDEIIALFQYSWVAIVARDGTYEIARID